jgi:hypothetical protein
MKTTVLTLAAVASVTCLASSLPAAEQGQPSEIFIHARYFHCNQINVREADEAVVDLYKSELNDLVKGGKVGSWGWLVKKTGGEWSRAGYLTASSLPAVLQAGDELSIRSDWRFPVRAFATACGSSEDYIWHVLSGNDARGHRGKAALSTYYVCEQSREPKVSALAKLDALVKSELAPKYDKLVAAGKLTSWAWAEQALGGRYQRLATMSASAVEALIEAREDMSKAVSAVCSSHQDYIWEVQDQGP